MPDPNMRILVVDDNAMTRQTLKTMLRQLGFEHIEEARNGAHAHAKLKIRDFGFAVVDWKMPKMDGLELLRAVRADPSLAKLPILMVTSEAEKGKVITALQAGVNNYMVKPFTMAILKEKLNLIFK